jgi:hypothetical protein
MNPRSQIDDQQMLQLHSNTKTKGKNIQSNKRMARSADTFDLGDDSSHVDNEVDFDLAQS